ncbi:MAG: tRNA preQ1(34) S-adenosylmethionine ribosyltransferase-isomerase QueA [Acidobacteria bacterium]|nr:tRNA preQ1(34) S-adenosylmethionine ribosyltransferase-isomerase QueA [Acidobacteriota bacterium]
MDVRDFDFELPSELIAQEPPPDRGASRLLRLDRRTGELAHLSIAALPDLLDSGDLLVVNDTRVFAARLIGRRVPSGGAVECLLLRRVDPARADGSDMSGGDMWEALMHPGQKLGPGARVVFEPPEGASGGLRLHGEVVERRFHGRRVVRLRPEGAGSIDAVVDAIGHVPLPPYIKRDDRGDDRARYQTVFARARGSIAAPTAGLHFTPPLIAALAARGVEIAQITLHVGYGTFQPVRVERVEDHRLEAEPYVIEPPAASAIAAALRDRRRIVAVGTTTTRTLEAVARAKGTIAPGAGQTDLFIHPGFDFRAIGGLITNFHLPRSSLLMLVSAFAGRERVLSAYRRAIDEGYRFYSYGDAMLIL